MKQTFIIRTEWKDAIFELSDIQQSLILKNLFYYHSEMFDKIDVSDLGVRLVWKLIEPNLERNISSYDKRCETSKLNGALGGRPPKEIKLQEEKPKEEPNKPIEPNETLSDSDSDSVIDIDSDTDNEIIINNKLLIPPKEEKLKVKKPKEEKSDYPLFVSAFFDFYKNKVGVKYYFTKVDGSAMKAIIKYLTEISKTDAVEAWKYILANNDKWDVFYQDQLKLTQINSNLPNILNNIKNGISKFNQPTERQRREQRDAETLRTALDYLKTGGAEFTQ